MRRKKYYQLEPLPDSLVPVTRDPTTKVALPSEVGDGIQWNLLIFIDEYLKLAYADVQVGLVEPIGDVPAKWAELALFLHQRMEEAWTKEVSEREGMGRGRWETGREGRGKEGGREGGREGACNEI